MRTNLCISALAMAAVAWAQEASSGFADPVTVSFFTGQTPRLPKNGGMITPAFRAMFYPTLKLGDHWFAYGAAQVHSTPYFYEELGGAQRVKFNLLQAYVGYTRVRSGRSFTVKAGQLTSAFGSFPLRYDDARNWTIDLPQSYGYYYFPVTVYGMPGAEVNATLGKLDARAQLTASSPSNPRGWRDSDQYANWTLGGGYTIRQGFRVGASWVRGPYLHRQHRFFFPREAAPNTLPAMGYGVDVQWARGKWNLNAEAQRFQYAYRAVPYFFNSLVYGEVKWNANARWYLAGRAGTRWRSRGAVRDGAYEAVVGYRPAPGHLMKIGYLMLEGPLARGVRDNVLGVQYVMQFNPPTLAW